ncbi:MAG: Holliday junction branch migration protein RuvA [Candidatus Dormibacteria bacterium]
MIAALRGTPLRVEEEWAVLDVGGVGYQVYIHPRTAHWLAGASGEVTVQVHTVVREDAISLYGFAAVEELACFRQLLSVERIGPKAALAILARSDWRALISAIVAGDHSLLAAVPGIGAKTAQRIVLELKGRVDTLLAPDAPRAQDSAASLGDRAVEALVALGFPVAEARKVVAGELMAAPAGARRTIEDVVGAALRRLDQSGQGATT